MLYFSASFHCQDKISFIASTFSSSNALQVIIFGRSLWTLFEHFFAYLGCIVSLAFTSKMHHMTTSVCNSTYCSVDNRYIHLLTCKWWHFVTFLPKRLGNSNLSQPVSSLYHVRTCTYISIRFITPHTSHHQHTILSLTSHILSFRFSVCITCFDITHRFQIRPHYFVQLSL